MGIKGDIHISHEELNHLFPFYIILNNDFIIKDVGKSVFKLFPNLPLNVSFFENFAIERPLLDDQTNFDFKKILSQLVIIECLFKADLKLKGQFEYIAKEKKIIFLGSPWLESTEKIIENHLTIRDFAIHDSTVDLLHVLKNNEIANKELSDVLNKINIQKQLLVRDQQSLRNKETMLQKIAEATDILLANTNIREAILQSFEIIGNTISIDTICLNENHQLEENIEWNNNESNLVNFSSNIHSYLLENSNHIFLKRNNKIDFNKELESIHKQKSFRSFLKEQGIKSVLIIPIYIQNIFYGYLSFVNIRSEKIWSNTERSLLKSFTNSISSAIERYQNTMEIKSMALFPLENPDPVIRIDLKGNVILRNESAKKLTHFEILGVKRPDDVLFRFLSRLLNRKNRQLIFEGKFRNLYYQVTARLAKNNETINIYLSNITKQKEAEEEILKANDQLTLFQNLINNSSDALQVSYESGELVYINKTASDDLGISIEECENYKVKDYDLRFKKDKAWEDFIITLKKVDHLTLESTHKHISNNAEFPVETTVKRIQIGEIAFIVANSRNVTERKIQERQIKLQEDKYRNIIANMNLGLLEVDLDEKIQFCNQSFTEISGFKLDEMRGKKTVDLFLETSHKATILEKVEARKHGKSDNYEVLVRNKKKELRWWLISGAPKYNDKGEIIGSIGINLDITDQKKLEKKLEMALKSAQAASEAKEKFLANMSHEIRTPLNGIIGMIRELDKEKLNSKQQYYVDSSKKASNHLLSIINNILDLSKIEAGELSLDPSDFNLKEVILDVKKILEIQAFEKKLKLKIDIDKNINEALIGDVSRVRQILINLAGNSIKFTNEGNITISCVVLKELKNKQKIEIKISDTGIGMDKSYLNKIFTKFQQEDISSSRRHGGTGLGMVITKELIELMHGRIQVQSEKNIGTTITIQIDFELGNPAKIVRNEEPANLDILVSKRILLVEDNEMNRFVAINALRPYKMEIKEAENGKEAVEILKTENFDLILMDLQMPIMGGLESTKIIRKKLKIKTPIIALTANAFKSEIDKCLEAGMNNYVIKPFEKNDLINNIYKEIALNHVPLQTETLKMMETKPAEDLYNLDQLIEMSDNNEEFIQRILGIFVDTIGNSIQDLELAIDNEDYTYISKIAHKIKPSLGNMNIKTLEQDILDLEIFDLGQFTIDELITKCKYVTTTLKLIIQSIQKLHIK
jgi:PAS domain S-box-containing protein